VALATLLDGIELSKPSFQGTSFPRMYLHSDPILHHLQYIRITLAIKQRNQALHCFEALQQRQHVITTTLTRAKWTWAHSGSHKSPTGAEQ
jgi:hypothetical protein